MKKIILIVYLFLLARDSYSQDLSEIKFSNASTLSFFSFLTDQKIVIRVSPDGKINEWGNIWEKGYYNYQPGKLQEYMGRVEYYGTEADSINRGKVKNIGTCYITYYGKFEIATNAGKVKSIGRTYLDYYTNFDNDASEGKLKSAGNTMFAYYNSFDNIAVKGKLKSVGANQINYYNSFDDKKIQGKVKSIGSVNYVWYNSNDRREYQGSLKSGSIEQVINGVKYIMQ